MTTIIYKGKEEKAYNLLMRRENAIDIINGKKQVEIRAFTDKYVSMFVDQAIVESNEQHDDHECPIREDVRCIRFRDYNNSWNLDVSIAESGICSLIEDDVQMLQEDFDFHDFDEELLKHKDTPEEDRPMFFWFKIGKILSNNLKF